MMGSQLMFYIYSNTVCIILEQYYCSQVGWVLLDKMRSREMLGQYETVVPNVDCDFDPVATPPSQAAGDKLPSRHNYYWVGVWSLCL